MSETVTGMFIYIGMPATYNIGSDHYGGRIIAASKTRHRLTFQVVRSDTSTSFTKEFTRRRDGRYIAIGDNYGSLTLGVAETVLDEGF